MLIVIVPTMGNTVQGQISDSNRQKAALLDKQLQQAGFTQDKIDNMITTANDIIGCGPECQKAKKVAALRAKVNKISQQIKTGPSQLQAARRDLITLEHGSHAYTHAKMQQYREEADELIRNFRAEHDKDVSATKESISQLAIAQQAMTNANVLKEKEEKAYKAASQEVDDATAAVRTNTRRGQYAAETIDTLSSAEKIVMVGYFICVAFYLYKSAGSIFREGGYKKPSMWVLWFVLITFPYLILPWVGGAVFWVASKLAAIIGLNLSYTSIYGKKQA